MIAWTSDDARHQDEFNDCYEADRFERFTHRDRGNFPVRSNSAQTRAMKRSRGTPAARQKARSFRGANRRGRGKQWSVVGSSI
jgi:hypothetical protein